MLHNSERLDPEIWPWTGGVIKTWWSEFETGMAVKRVTPYRAEHALALALHDHLYPGTAAFGYCFGAPFWRFVKKIYAQTLIGMATESRPDDQHEPAP